VPWIFAVRETLRPTPRVELPDVRALTTASEASQAAGVRRGLIACLWLTWIAVAVGGRFYEHYFIQFAPPLALVAAPNAAHLLSRWATLAPWKRWLWGVGLGLPPVLCILWTVTLGLNGAYPAQEPRTRALAGWLQQHTSPDERLFIWGHYSPIYYLSDRMPGTRYITTSVHVGNFDPEHLDPDFDPSAFVSWRDVDDTVKDLEANQVAIVVDTAPSGIHGWNHFPLSMAPPLADYVRSHYSLVGEAGGARIYRRNAGQASRDSAALK
jgi:hypothetical protein